MGFSLHKETVSKHVDSPLVGSSPSSSEVQVQLETKSPLLLSLQLESVISAESAAVTAASTFTATTTVTTTIMNL